MAQQLHVFGRYYYRIKFIKSYCISCLKQPTKILKLTIELQKQLSRSRQFNF